MRLLLAPLTLILLLAGCDSSEPEDQPFSLTVTAETASGDPVSGLETYVRYLPAGSAARGGEGPSPTTTFLASPTPNPASGASRLQFAIAEDGPVRINLLAVDSTLVETLYDEQTPVGDYSLGFDTRPIPGGAYRVQLVTAGETIERWLLVNDDPTLVQTFNFGRRLGTTGADGAVETSDRAVALSLFDLPSVEVTDEQGNVLGVVSIPNRVEVVVTEGSREVTRTLRLVDGANEVALVW